MTARLLALILLMPAAASAQESPAQFRLRVAQLSDTVELRSLERHYADAASGAAAIAAGLAALRLWEVTGERTHARRSRHHFDRAADREPRSAWAHYGHALSLQAEMEREPGFIVTHINASRDLGLDPVSRARRALERAVALDPLLPGAAELLARYSAETRNEDALRQARTAFEQAAGRERLDTSALLGVAATSRELGEYAAAADAARRALAADAGSAHAHLELALALAGIGDSLPAAGRAWDTALRLADDALLERLWNDAVSLRTAREAAAWDSAAADRRRALLHTFWDVRGMLGALTAGERAAEHYRRIAVARRRFTRRGMYGAAPGNALRLETLSTLHDDRGVIYIRHGEPERTFGEPPLQSYIVWFYTDENGDPRSFHFYRGDPRGASQDYVLMRNLPCPLDPMVVAFDARLTPLARQRCDGLLVRSVSALVNRDAERALRTDSHRPVFDGVLPFHFDAYTFRAEAGTELLLSIGVPLDRLPPGRRSLQVRLSLLDTATSAVTHATRTAGPVERDTVRGRIGRTDLSLHAAPGSGVYRIDVRDAADPRIGAIYGGPITLPDYGGDTLMVSDVLLAEQSDDGGLLRGDTRIALAPTQVFRDGELRIYYEIYNLPAGAAYSTELSVEPLRRGVRDTIRRLFSRDAGVRLRFADVVPAGAPTTLSQLRDVTAPFQAGAYMMRITIRSAAGAVTRERRFMIETDR